MLKQRIITALIMLPIFLGGLFWTSPVGFAWFTGVLVMVAAWEWARMGGMEAQGGRIAFAVATGALLPLGTSLPSTLVLLLAFVGWTGATWLVMTWPTLKTLWSRPVVRLVSGFLLLQATWLALLNLRTAGWTLAGDVPGELLILYVFLIVWCADVGAYFAGRRWGRRKLAPLVSPGKSVEGAVGGLVAVSVLPFLCGAWAGLDMSAQLMLWLVSLVTAAYSIVGDLLESLAKRVVGLKDSSQILPGHGGIMDRIDSVTAAAPIFCFLLVLLGWLSSSAGAA
ncbi:MAG: phosphatidate cytidylyltransferase [Hahellaceae bacterium]|nr:phosphatidate cytidylyltransferase [Hahellaceae bacterium]